MTKSRTDIEGVRLDIDRRGAKIAYEALLEVCQDRKAPAQAKAAAGVAVLRAGGLYDAKRRPEPNGPAEMSAAELREAMPVLTKELQRLEVEIAERAELLAGLGPDDDEDVDDIFG